MSMVQVIGMPKEEVTISNEPIMVTNEKDLTIYGELEQMGKDEFYTGRWGPFFSNKEKNQTLESIKNIAMKKGAFAVLYKELDNNFFDVKFFQ